MEIFHQLRAHAQSGRVLQCVEFDQDVDYPVRNVKDSVQGIAFHVIEFLGFNHRMTSHR